MGAPAPRGRRASEKVVRRLMRGGGSRWSTTGGGAGGGAPTRGGLGGPAEPGGQGLSAAAPDELWVTDVTEFRVPAGKVYLSAVVDCYDGRPAGWRIGPRPTASLANGSLLDALAARREGARTVVHSDRGGHYRWPGWIAICGEHGLARSMSARGAAPTTRPARGSSGGSRTSSSTTGTGGRLARGVLREAGRLPAVLARVDEYRRSEGSGRIKRSLQKRANGCPLPTSP